MAWHVKKHGIGSKYAKIEDGEKLKWVHNKKFLLKYVLFLFICLG